MQSKSESTNQLDLKPNPNAIPPGRVYEPRCHGIGYNSISPALAAGNVSNSSSLDCPNDSESNDVQSMSNEVNEEDVGVNKELQATASSRSVGHHGQENQTIQQDASAMPTMRDECFTQAPQLELVGHSIACASHPCQDPYYGGIMAAYGHQHVGYPQIAGMPPMPLPLEMAQEPVYVNSKQYMGILRRRQARAKADFEKKLNKDRKPYLHESRHQHALRRTRGTGGRFAKKTGDTSNSKGTSEEKGRGSEPIRPSQSGSSSGSEPLPSDSVETWNSSSSQQDATGSQAQNTNEARNHANGNGDYQNHSFQASTFHSHLGDRGEDGDCSDKQWGAYLLTRLSKATCYSVSHLQARWVPIWRM